MAIEVKRWMCSICNTTYPTKELAELCEESPIEKITIDVEVGDTISFDSEVIDSNEVNVLEMHESGEVLRKVVLLTDNDKHYEALLVRIYHKEGENEIDMERLVLQGFDGNFYSPANLLFNKGEYELFIN